MSDSTDENIGVLAGSGSFGTNHVVDTTTFDNSLSPLEDVNGHVASVGKAETLCGRELFGRLVPLEDNHVGCGTCERVVDSLGGDDE